MTAQLSKNALDVGIISADADRVVAFYRDVLGFAALGDIPFPGIGVVHRLRCGQSVLRVFEPDTTPTRDCRGSDNFYEATGLRYLTLAVSNLAEVVEAVRADGERVALEPTEIRPGVLAAQIRDPDGNWIELMQGA